MGHAAGEYRSLDGVLAIHIYAVDSLYTADYTYVCKGRIISNISIYMNKIALFLATVALLAPSMASARTISITAGSLDCDTGIVTDTLGATSTMSTDLCKAGGGPIVGTIQMSWGLLDGQTPTVVAGSIVTDERGKTGICPWFISMGCYDLTHTFWYRLANGYIDALGHNK